MTRIVFVWLPLWPIERLARTSPGAVPADRPFALVEAGSHGLIITGVNGVALSEGVRPGVALADARAALPSLVSQPAELHRDRAALIDLARWSGRYGPRRHVRGKDGIWIDVTGVAHLFGGEAALLGDLARRLEAFGLTARLGLADTFGAAFALARYAIASAPAIGAAKSMISKPGCVRSDIAGLPVSALRLADDTILLLRRLGLAHIGDLYALPRPSLERRFHEIQRSSSRKRAVSESAAVLARLDQALGLATEAMRPLEEPAEYAVRQPFPEPLVSSEPLMHAMAALTHALAANLHAVGRGIRRARLALFRVDGTVIETRIGTSRPSWDRAHILHLLTTKLGDVDVGFGIDLAVLDALETEVLDAEQGKFLSYRDERGAPGEPTTAMLLDRLTNRLGPQNVLAHVLNSSHIPERAEQLMPVSRAFPSHDPAPLADPAAAIAIPRTRPALLLERPEPIQVIAEMPEGPPARFTWRRLVRRVTRAEGPERIAPEWWRWLRFASASPCGRNANEIEQDHGRDPGRDRGDGSDETADGEAIGPVLPLPAHQPRVRDYYRIEDEQGASFWVFREGVYGVEAQLRTPQWFLHGIFP